MPETAPCRNAQGRFFSTKVRANARGKSSRRPGRPPTSGALPDCRRPDSRDRICRTASRCDGAALSREKGAQVICISFHSLFRNQCFQRLIGKFRDPLPFTFFQPKERNAGMFWARAPCFENKHSTNWGGSPRNCCAASAPHVKPVSPLSTRRSLSRLGQRSPRKGRSIARWQGRRTRTDAFEVLINLPALAPRPQLN